MSSCLVNSVLDIIEDCLIHKLDLFIRLGMHHQSVVEDDVILPTEVFEFLVVELFPIIHDQGT